MQKEACMKRKRKNLFLTLLFPNRCPVCDNVVSIREGLVCRGCRDKWNVIKAPFCLRCGRPLAIAENEYCQDCGKRKHFYLRGRALYKYGDVAKSIYRFKYGGRCEYATFFGEKMARELREFIHGIKPDGLVPVPLSKKRQNRRGYNQAELLARVLGNAFDIPVYDRLAVRKRDTVPQKELNALQRQNNLKKAFKITQNDVKLSTIIIIDDIYTTGSTGDALAEAFLQAGADKIYFVALAISAGS